MNFNEFHINGKYALSVALIAGLATIGASALQVYKPFNQSKKAKEIYLTNDDQNLYSLNYLVREGLSVNIFSNLKKEDFSINPNGNKIFYIQRNFSSESKGSENMLKIVNHDTSHLNEIILYSYGNQIMYDEVPLPIEKKYCQVSIKGWEKPNSIILNISYCSGSVHFTMTGYNIETYPQIKMTNGNYAIRNDGDYIISFDPFNKVSSVIPFD